MRGLAAEDQVDGPLWLTEMGRGIRFMVTDFDTFIESCRIELGTIPTLYPEKHDRDAS